MRVNVDTNRLDMVTIVAKRLNMAQKCFKSFQYDIGIDKLMMAPWKTQILCIYRNLNILYQLDLNTL